ncbi:putative Endonuclease/exonuclease/phosphatase, Non LTR Retrotransposon protein [Trachipleistophora hominis]|uniref:Putative Endonuclease/exonuclease/phosphatase, Non LTR Retrotransposon protein n=1 Tax=Trachipleistophora hominis TaxID=72359 RepID=L7JTQ6_TRAHO|nr:putative Endonuclease/exonuclease/phosphatase, Non LTR Retrotransposon protein [Trachipleistophora hominis]
MKKAVEAAAHNVCTVPRLRTHIRSCNKDTFTRLEIWNWDSFTLKDVRKLLKRKLKEPTPIKRIKQRNGKDRIDLYIKNESLRKVQIIVTELIYKTNGFYKILKTNTNAKNTSNQAIKFYKEDNNKNTATWSNLKLWTLNICGLFHKKEELAYTLRKRRPEIVTLQETLMKTMSYRPNIPGYIIIETKMSNQPGARGLAILVKKGMGHKVNKYADDTCFLAASATGKNKDGQNLVILFVSVYIPIPSEQKKAALNRLASFLRREKQENKFTEIIISGDWNDTPSDVLRALRMRLLSPCEDFIAFKARTRWTRNINREGRCIDFGISLNNTIITKQKVLRDVDLSDHYPVSITLTSISMRKPTEKYILNLKRLLDNETKNSIMSDTRWRQTMSLDVEECDKRILELTNTLLIEHGIRKKKCETVSASVSSKTRRAIKRRKIYFRKHKNSNFSWQEYDRLRKAAKKCVEQDRKRRHKNWLIRGVNTFINNQSKAHWQWVQYTNRRREFATT